MNSNRQSEIVCAKCGIELTETQAELVSEGNYPGCCEQHQWDVLEQASQSVSMWPSGWVGRSWEDPDGRWHYE